MDKGLSSFTAGKLSKALRVAQELLSEAYPNDVPLSAFYILCIIYQKHMQGGTATIQEVSKTLPLSEASISRAISKMSVWANLKQRGAGYLDKGKDYNDAGRQITTICMTEKGLAIIERILEPMQ